MSTDRFKEYLKYREKEKKKLKIINNYKNFQLLTLKSNSVNCLSQFYEEEPDLVKRLSDLSVAQGLKK